MRLFCFHHVGGSAAEFRRWSDALGPDIDVLGVQMPGRENRLREPPFDRMEPLVDAIVKDLCHLMDRPIALLGHSLGAHVAVEVARRLVRHPGIELTHFFASGTRGPGCPTRPDDKDLYELPDDELKNELREFGGTPPEILDNEEIMELVLPVIRADFAVAETHIHRGAPPLHCPLTPLGGTEDKDVSAAELMTWSKQTTGDFRQFLFPGDHFYLRASRDRVMKVIANRLLVPRDLRHETARDGEDPRPGP